MSPALRKKVWPEDTNLQWLRVIGGSLKPPEVIRFHSVRVRKETGRGLSSDEVQTRNEHL